MAPAKKEIMRVFIAKKPNDEHQRPRAPCVPHVAECSSRGSLRALVRHCDLSFEQLLCLLGWGKTLVG